MKFQWLNIPKTVTLNNEKNDTNLKWKLNNNK